MSSTNKTLTIELSQYVGTDKPTYLSDYNGDMLKIDNAIAADRDSIATAQSKADGADAKADTNATAISTLDGQINNASNGLTKRVTDVEGDVNTIESLIGNGTPTTTDKTIIGAINELNSDIDGINADIVAINAKLYHTVATVAADGVKTYAQLLNELYTALSEHPADISGEAVMIAGDSTEYGVFNLSYVSPSLGYIMSHSYVLNSKCTTDCAVINNNSSEYSRSVSDANGTAITSLGNSVPVVGYTFVVKSII